MKSWGAFLFFFFIFLNNSHSYVYQKSTYGDNAKWVGKNNLSLYIDTTNSSGVSDFIISSALGQAVSTWSQSNAPTLNLFSGVSTENGRNDIVFSNSSSFFSGGSVLAVTQTIYNEVSGEILEGNIYIRDSISTGSFATDQALIDYLGSIITHEMGHFLGLDHSQVLYSSMFYSVTNGQQTIHTDDESGANHLYGVSSSHGSISGTIAGGEDIVPVFGAHVEAISSLTGKVVAGVFTEEDGTFTIDSLPLDDVYFIYVSPMEDKDTLTSHYSSVREDFCPSGNSFRGSFFQSCSKSREGHPQGVKLTTANSARNIGTVTIQCGLDTPLDYFINRDAGLFEIETDGVNLGEAIVGYFTSQDISDNAYDLYKMDLSTVNIPESGLNLEIKLTSHDFKSNAQYNVEVSTLRGTTIYTVSTDSDSNPTLNVVARVSLDVGFSNNNEVTVKIIPSEFQDWLDTQSTFTTGDVFPTCHEYMSGSTLMNACTKFLDRERFYLLTFNVTKSNGGSYELYSHYDYEPIRDNSTCMEGTNTLEVKSSSSFKNSDLETLGKKKAADQSALSCGTIDLDNNEPPQGGMFSLVLGIGLVLLLGQRRRSRFF